ncbi:excisionase family DNA-binding protein [Phyllobacterium zundukense]|uniref:excisionase family DNA-binding protein n=1 Tax=Phyllobacterium zundukense TaxID=1867719 RepID=UPI003965D5EA
MVGPTVFTPRTLAQRWQCSERHVRTMIATGELPSFRLGGKLLRIRAEEVDLIEQKQISAPASAESPPQVESPVIPTKRPRAARIDDDPIMRARLTRLRESWEKE